MEKVTIKNEKPIRILVYAPLGIGGVSNLMLGIQEGMDRNRINFDYLVVHDRVEPQEYAALKMGSRKIVASADEICFKPLRAVVRLFKIRKVCRRNSIKIFHFNGGAPIGFFTMLAAKLGGVKWITFHSHNGGAAQNGMVAKMLNAICRPFLNLVVDDYWACSSIAANFSFPRKIVKKKAYYFIPNAIELDKYKYNLENRNKVRNELDINNRFVVGHAGRFNVQKNHIFLIDIFSKIHEKKSDTVLLLFGTGELEESIKGKVFSMGLDSCVKFCGPSNEMNRMYQALDIFLMPSLYEGLPVTGVEAQAAGLPIVFSDTITREVAVSPNIRYMSLNDSADEWADTALELLNTPRKDYCSELAEKGFDKDNMVKHFQSYYLELGKRI